MGISYIKRGSIIATNDLYQARGSNRKAYLLWLRMLTRCFDTSSKDYKYYGARGVTVCDEWLVRSKFEEDIKSLPNYNKWLVEKGWDLDKDILANGSKIYSKSTCQFIRHSDNCTYANKHSRTTTSRAKGYYVYDEEYRRVIYLRTLKDVADFLNTSIGTVKGILAQTRSNVLGFEIFCARGD